MKNLLILLLFISANCMAQCNDTCQYKTYFMHNADTSKYSSIEMSQQGILIITENKTLGLTTSFQIDSFNSTMDMSGYWNSGMESNHIGGDKNNGIEISSSKSAVVSAPIVKLQAGNYFITIESIGNKTIIKAPQIPNTCTGQTSGTWANISGFLKVCP